MPKNVEDRFINKASDCNILQFRRCKFDEDYDALIISGHPSQKDLKNAFLQIYLDYIDTSGLAWDSTEKLLMKRELQLEGRQMVIKYALFLQEMSMRANNEPYEKGFAVFEPHGYQLHWYDDLNDFREQIENIKTSELSYDYDLAEVKKQIKDHREAKKKDPETPNDSENAFLDMLNNMERFGYRIDEEKLSVKRLALMINRYIKLTDKNNHSKN